MPKPCLYRVLPSKSTFSNVLTAHYCRLLANRIRNTAEAESIVCIWAGITVDIQDRLKNRMFSPLNWMEQATVPLVHTTTNYCMTLVQAHTLHVSQV